MKCALFLAFLAISASCIVAQNITTWGDVLTSRPIHEQRVFAPSAIFRVQNRTVTYITVSSPPHRQILAEISYTFASKRNFAGAKSSDHSIQNGSSILCFTSFISEWFWSWIVSGFRWLNEKCLNKSITSLKTLERLYSYTWRFAQRSSNGLQYTTNCARRNRHDFSVTEHCVAKRFRN